jgi:glycosyltransferase involved in cell wall biosynthesis
MNPSLGTTKKPSVCLVHDWLVAMRGGEKVLEVIAGLFPEAPIYTLFLERGKLSPELQKREIHTSFLQYIPGVSKFYRWLLPLFPIAVWLMNVRQFDLVISSSHCAAKAVRARKDAVHICYCHTPMRYLWGFSEDYFGRFPKLLQWFIEFYFKWLRKWDVKNSKKVNFFIANSQNTANKIKQLYDKPAKVIYPPVEFPNTMTHSNKIQSGDYFLMVSALVPYKRVDLAIEAFNQLKLPLRIVGDGPLRSKWEGAVQFEGIVFDGWLDPEKLHERYAHCRALIFPGEEDFGIVPLEAQAYGKPVIAYGKGGSLETVLAINSENQSARPEKSTGIFFYHQTKDELVKAVLKFNDIKFDESFIRSHAYGFGQARFESEFSSFLESVINQNLHKSFV